jgi:hypothetical protein
MTIVVGLILSVIVVDSLCIWRAIKAGRKSVKMKGGKESNGRRKKSQTEEKSQTERKKG